MNKEDLKKDFKKKNLELRKILNSWDLIPDSPKDEFDSLNHQILSHLYKGSNFFKIAHFLDTELTVTYGLSADKEDAEKKAAEIMEWWKATDKL